MLPVTVEAIWHFPIFFFFCKFILNIPPILTTSPVFDFWPVEGRKSTNKIFGCSIFPAEPTRILNYFFHRIVSTLPHVSLTCRSFTIFNTERWKENTKYFVFYKYRHFYIPVFQRSNFLKHLSNFFWRRFFFQFLTKYGGKSFLTHERLDILYVPVFR